MRSGNWRAAAIALGLSCVLAFTVTASCRADLFHTIPTLVPAVDVNTGGPYYAPPIPYGHYTGKNLGGKISGLLHGGLLGKGVCGACGGKGCGLCGGNGGNGGPCANGNGLCGGGHGMGDPCGSTGVSSGGHGCGICGGRGGLFHKHGAGICGPATTFVVPSAQSVPMPSEQCADPGCGFGGKHCHKGKGLCGACGGKGGPGCGLCHGSGLFGNGCGACGGKGCGLCGGNGNGNGGTGCGLCGGKGCAACAKARGLVNHLLGRDQIKWFVGPGGPVPLTPGYTPYVVTTRSPRDFLAFPPFVP